MVSHIFFDLGSTLLDETAAVRARIAATVEQLRGTPHETSLEAFTALMEHAAQQANCLPENAVMVGDRLDNDIAPAKALGMQTIWIRQGWGGKAAIASGACQPNITIDTLQELQAAIATLAKI